MKFAKKKKTIDNFAEIYLQKQKKEAIGATIEFFFQFQICFAKNIKYKNSFNRKMQKILSQIQKYSSLWMVKIYRILNF